MIDRRKFSIALGFAALSPAASRAQQSSQSPVHIGFIPLGSASNKYDSSLVQAFREGLHDAGLIENRQIILDVAWVENEQGYAKALDDMRARGCKLLVTAGTSASRAAKLHTGTIPIVFITVGDPVGIGLVKTLARPGGNITGFSDVLLDLSGKFVDIAIEIEKSRETINYLWHTGWANGKFRFDATERAAKRSGARLQARGIEDIAEVNDALAALKKSGRSTVIVQPGPLTFRYRSRIIDVAMSHRLATIFAWPAAATEGAVVAYGPNYAEIYRRSAAYVDRILKGANPASLPVEQPTKFEMIVNLNTAKTLGLKVPESILVRADQVIEGSVY